MDVYGLTGGIGSGKSAVAELLEEYGIPVVSADELSRMVVAKGSEGMHDVVQAFGTDVLDEFQELDRKAMGQIVFRDPEKRRQLEAILHPRIRERYEQVLDALEKGGHTVAVYEVPLLFEKNLQGDMKAVVLVTADEQTRIQRVRLRDGLAEDEIRARIAAQMSDDEKRKKADYIIYNEGSLDDLRREVEQMMSRFLKLPPRSGATASKAAAPSPPPPPPSSERTHVGPPPEAKQSLTRTLPPGDPSAPAGPPPPPKPTAKAAAKPPSRAATKPPPPPTTQGVGAGPPPPPGNGAAAAPPPVPAAAPAPPAPAAAAPAGPPPPPAPAAAGSVPAPPLPPRPRRSTMAYPPKGPAGQTAKGARPPKSARKDDAGNESEPGK